MDSFKDKMQEGWHDRVKKKAMHFAEVTEHNFKGSVGEAMHAAPLKENRPEVLSMYVEALLGTTVGLLASLVSTAEGFEKEVIRNISERFAFIRGAQARSVILKGPEDGRPDPSN